MPSDTIVLSCHDNYKMKKLSKTMLQMNERIAELRHKDSILQGVNVGFAKYPSTGTTIFISAFETLKCTLLKIEIRSADFQNDGALRDTGYPLKIWQKMSVAQKNKKSSKYLYIPQSFFISQNCLSMCLKKSNYFVVQDRQNLRIEGFGSFLHGKKWDASAITTKAVLTHKHNEKYVLVTRKIQRHETLSRAGFLLWGA